MDPNQTWIDLIRAWRAGDGDLVRERARDLIDWLDRGGFPPTITAPALTPQLPASTAAYFVRHVCKDILRRRPPRRE